MLEIEDAVLFDDYPGVEFIEGKLADLQGKRVERAAQVVHLRLVVELTVDEQRIVRAVDDIVIVDAGAVTTALRATDVNPANLLEVDGLAVVAVAGGMRGQVPGEGGRSDESE